jgi:PAS domain S-box-containing protein
MAPRSGNVPAGRGSAARRTAAEGPLLARLYAAASALTAGGPDEEQLHRRIVTTVADLTQARYAALGLLDPTTGDLDLFVTMGLTEAEYDLVKDNPPHGRRGILGALLREGRPLRLEDLGQDPRAVGFPPGHPPMRSFLGVPLHLDGAVIGRLYMTESAKGAFDADDEQLAMGFAVAASVAIANARLTTRLRESAARLTAIIEAFERGFVMTDLAGRVVFGNGRVRDLLGLDRPLLGRAEAEAAVAFASPEPFLSALALERAQPAATMVDEFTLRGDPPRVVRRYGAPVRTADGEQLGRIAVYADVTAEQERETQLVATERLRATGEMASGIAHDFNNVLATILGRAEVVLGQAPDPALRENILAIQRAARDGAATVARMREYGRALDAGEFRPVRLDELVRAVVELTQPRWRDQAQREGRTIEIALALAPGLATLGDAAALRDVLVNLVFNAVDAMPVGGRLTLGLAPAGAGAELSVRDTGVGMPAAVVRRVFEPFFSTKGERGSGLGLAMARKTVVAHGGRIDVASTPGQGTTVTIWLPTTADVAAGEATPLSDAEAAGRVGRIVVVDDQKDVLDTTAMLLRGDGHDVRVYQDPRQALAAVRDDPPDLVISDLGMPGMNGWDVARAVHARHPDLPVVLLTGWGREVSAQQMREAGVAGVLAKPVEGSPLRRAVAAALRPAPRLLRVLLVDDSAAFAAVLAMLVAQAGHETRHAGTVAAADAALAEWPADLVLVDAHLPDGPASQVVAAARAARSRPAVVAMSGGAVSEMEAAVPGADLYVEKVRLPQRLEELVLLATARRA